MQEEVILTPDERLVQISDSLIQSIIKSDDVSLSNRGYLFGQLPVSVFRNENYVIYSVFSSFRDRGITPDSDFMRMHLMRNMKVFKDGEQYIDLTEFRDLDDNPYQAYASAVLKKFNRLLTLDVLSEDEFKLSVEKYRMEYCAYETGIAYSQGKMILYDGMQYGKRMLQGYSDSSSYVKSRIAEIEGVLDSTAGAGFIDSSKVAISSDRFNTKSEKVSDFDLVEELNEYYKGIYTGVFYSIVAPTKGGKSKFTSRLVHTALVKYGTNVSVWAHEGGYEAWWAQLRSIHFEYLYIRHKSDGERVAPLSQKDILWGIYPSAEIKALEDASMLDLFTNPAYGRVAMIDRPFLQETFIEEVDTSVKSNQSKMVLIDYLQLISTKELGVSKSVAIGKAYQAGLAYCKKVNVALCSPAQFTQDFMKEMAKATDGQGHEVRTSGGESSEVIRTPDVNIALYATTEDLIRKEMTVMAMPSRLFEPFPDFKMYADLCCSVFSSIRD